MTMLDELPADVRACYPTIRELPDGRIIALTRFIHTWGLIVDIDPTGYADRYCYHHPVPALAAFLNWTGTGDPEGWHRQTSTGRRRDPVTGAEWIEF